MTVINGAERKLIDNERAKLTATYVNGMAVAIFAVGGLAPLITMAGTIKNFDPGLATGVATMNIQFSGASLLISLICFTTSAILHWAARQSLRRLRP